jgi:transcriptional regulator with XRE-family HTH domain
MSTNYSNSIKPIVLGDQLRSARLKLNNTLKTVESLTNINHSQISRIERGKFKSPSKNVQNLCKLFNIDWRNPSPSNQTESLGLRLDRAANASPKWAAVVAAFAEAIEAAQGHKN